MKVIAQVKDWFIYIVIGVLYFVLPKLLFRDTGSGMFTLLTLIPIVVFTLSLFHARKKGFEWYFPIIVGLLWLPQIFWMNDSATIYALIYGVVSFLGQIVGLLTRRKA